MRACYSCGQTGTWDRQESSGNITNTGDDSGGGDVENQCELVRKSCEFLNLFLIELYGPDGLRPLFSVTAPNITRGG